MRGRIPDEILDSIRERTSIVEVVSGHVALKKAGRNYVGLCPFHAEKTPSFSVSEDRGLYHCFGCGESGSVFSFLMRVEGLDFVGAVEQLASKAGVRLPEDGSPRDRDDRNRFFQLNEAAQRRYATALQGPAGEQAREYLAARGIEPATIERFGLGFCPAEGSELLAAIRDRPQAVDAAITLGLVGRRADGRLYDRQWGRVTFPIRDGSGRVVGFGGRALGDRQPKYLNSPESPLFHKGRVLYGLFEARAAVRGSERVVIVEGYLDVLALVQSGIENVVANLGTAVTEDQLRLAKRFGAAETIAFFDGDRAGRSAALRTFELCAASGLVAYGAFLPEGEDPDSFVRRHGTAATQELLARPVSLAEYFLDSLDPGANASLVQRQEATQRAGAVLSRVADPVQFSLLARLAAERLGVDEATFRELRRRAKPGPPPPQTRSEALSVGQGLNADEAALLCAMALSWDACDVVVEAVSLEEALAGATLEVARSVVAAWREGGEGAALDRLPLELAGRVASARLGEGPLAGLDAVRLARDCLARIERRRAAERLREARRRLHEAERQGDENAVRAGLQETHRLLPAGVRPPLGRS